MSAEFVHGVSINNNFISGAPTDFNLFGFIEAWHAKVVPKPAASERRQKPSQYCDVLDFKYSWFLDSGQKQYDAQSPQGYPDVVI